MKRGLNFKSTPSQCSGVTVRLGRFCCHSIHPCVTRELPGVPPCRGRLAPGSLISLSHCADSSCPHGAWGAHGSTWGSQTFPAALPQTETAGVSSSDKDTNPTGPDPTITTTLTSSSPQGPHLDIRSPQGSARESQGHNYIPENDLCSVPLESFWNFSPLIFFPSQSHFSHPGEDSRWASRRAVWKPAVS